MNRHPLLMRFGWVAIILSAGLTLPGSDINQPQRQGSQSENLRRVSVDDLIAPGATLQKLAGDVQFGEGPAADSEGNVFFSDIPASRCPKGSVDGNVSIYDINADGTLANKRFFAPVAADGVTMDNDGNLYFCENAVLVYDPSGKKIGTIEVPAQPTNVCFGGRDAHTLFITTRPALFSLKMGIGGTAKSNRSMSAKQ